MGLRDGELALASLAGNRVAFGLLASRHRARIHGLVARMLRDEHEAEDVTQEALLQAYLGLGALRDPERFGAWLAAIATNLARMRLRRRADVPVGVVERPVEATDLLRTVREAIEGLPQAEREAAVLFYVQGLSCQEAATLLGQTPGAVRVRLHRARRKLRESLRELAPATVRAREEPEMIEMTVDDVVSRFADDELVNERMRVVLLREKGGERVLPIWIGAPEGDMLVLGMAGEETPRPMTADLAARLVEALGGKVERVIVSSLRENTFFAVIAVSGPERRTEVDARPSDAINLATRAGAPIYVDEAVLEQAGFAANHLEAKLGEEEELVTGEPAKGTWQSVSPELVRTFWKMFEPEK
jgi:RNA polymerase sigma factor (sigma-70 family)